MLNSYFTHCGENHNLSIGGPTNNTNVISSKTITPINPLNGINILGVNINNVGIGRLNFVKSNGLLSFYFPIGTLQGEVFLGSDGIYRIGGENNIIFSLTSSLLPVSDASIDLTISTNLGGFIRNITHSERSAGIVIYRCLYIYNPFDYNIINLNLTKNDVQIGSLLFGNEYENINFSGLTALDVENFLISDLKNRLLLESGFNVDTINEDYYHLGQSFYGSQHQRSPHNQQSNGLSLNTATQLIDEYDSTNLLPLNLNWTESLFFPLLLSKSFIAFWLKYEIPPGSHGPTIIESINLKLEYGI